jgi:uncharacterized protein (TIGR02246 family)
MGTLKTTLRPLAGCLVFWVCALANTGFAGDVKIEQELRDLDAQWAAAAAAKDLDKTVSYFSDDAIVMPPNMPSATTKDAIRKLWQDMIGSSASVSWQVSRVEVAKSGDMAYLAGSYQVTMKDAEGKESSERGKYLEVWKKQADGKWKCGADIWNSDLPIVPAEKK